MKIKSIDGNEPFDDIQNNSMNIRSIYILQKVAFKYGLRILWRNIFMKVVLIFDSMEIIILMA